MLRAVSHIGVTVVGMSGILDDLARRAEQDELQAARVAESLPTEIRLSQESLVGYMTDAARRGLFATFGIHVAPVMTASSISTRAKSVVWNLGSPSAGPVAPVEVVRGGWLHGSGWFHARGKLVEVTVSVCPEQEPVVFVVVVTHRWWGDRRRAVRSATDFRAELLR